MADEVADLYFCISRLISSNYFISALRCSVGVQERPKVLVIVHRIGGSNGGAWGRAPPPTNQIYLI